MTTWLDWRTEPQTDVAEEVVITSRKSRTSNHVIYKIYCEPCDWWEVAIDDPTEAEELRDAHVAWHMEGCPQ